MTFEFWAIPLAGIIFIVYNCMTLAQAYHIWSGVPEEIWGMDAAVQIGTTFSNILNIIFICASVFLLWSFINRNALSLASAYSAMTVTGFMFYWYFTLAALDPTDNNSIAVLENMRSGMNYIVWGTIVAAAVLLMTVIVKLAGRKKVG